jgi:hypothetical protein
MISLRAVHSRAAVLHCNGIRLINNQKIAGNVLQYVKRITLTNSGLCLPRILNSNFSNFSTSQKLVPKLLVYQCRPFHATRPTSVMISLATLKTLAVIFAIKKLKTVTAIFAIKKLKTVTAILVIKKLNYLLYSMFPLALSKHLQIKRQRRLLIFIITVTPLTGICILILASLEKAPHTGRLRIKFMSKEEERLHDLAFSREREKYRNNILSLDRPECEFVYHVGSNLSEGLNNDLMTLKSFKNLNDKESSEKAANIIEENVDNMSDKDTNVQQGEQNPKPFEIYVVEDDEMVNAISFGASKKIIIFTGNVITRLLSKFRVNLYFFFH